LKRLKLIASISYAASFFFGANLFFTFIPGLTINKTLIIFLTLGGLGFVLNLISYTKDKTGNPSSNLTYWLGSFFVFTGLVFKMIGTPFISIIIMSFPVSKILIIAGSILLLFSLFQMRRRKIKTQNEEEILDQP
jgi:hypothetical protein